jgi:methyltransferase (TIGR00027 family)
VRVGLAAHLLAAQVARGPVQWVLLGAGFDMFAWRHPERAEVPQFEVDHPDTQSHKRALVSRLGLTPPPRHRWVACDFERMRVADALRAAGFDASVPAVFAWLGVTYYLTRDAIVSTLTEVASLAAPGSMMVCDYRLPDRFIAPSDAALARKGDRLLMRWGEPHITRLELVDWRQMLPPTGWTIDSTLDADELAARFARDGLRPLSYYGLLTLCRATDKLDEQR